MGPELEGWRPNITTAVIVDAHYFPGGSEVAEASNKSNQLYYDRVFDGYPHVGGRYDNICPAGVRPQRPKRGRCMALAGGFRAVHV